MKTVVAWYCRAWSAIKTLSMVLSKPNWEGWQREKRGNLKAHKAHGVAGVSEDSRAILSEGLHIEWCKSQVQANQWTEEVELLQEEMYHVADFLSWHAGWWEKHMNRRNVLATPEQKGIKGYVKCQAALWRAMHDRFQEMWSIIPAHLQSLSPAMEYTMS
ncbi:hypothetical protein BDR06DRAFT_976177 [Suillus hirtellus]|nr:hypothetical protein BDR06DRAFT_976177 [Suillus hirtellus]